MVAKKDSDVIAVAKKCASSKPTLVSYGDISYVPHYDAVAAAMSGAFSGAKQLPKLADAHFHWCIEITLPFPPGLRRTLASPMPLQLSWSGDTSLARA